MNIFIKTYEAKLINLDIIHYIKPKYIYPSTSDEVMMKIHSGIELIAVSNTNTYHEMKLLEKKIEITESQLGAIHNAVQNYIKEHFPTSYYLGSKRHLTAGEIILGSPKVVYEVPIIDKINKEINSYGNKMFDLLINKFETLSCSNTKPFIVFNMNEVCKEMDKLYPFDIANAIGEK